MGTKMSESQIVRIYTREPEADYAEQTTADLVVSVGGTEVWGVRSVSFGEGGTFSGRGVIEATIRVLVRIGKE